MADGRYFDRGYNTMCLGFKSYIFNEILYADAILIF